MRPLNRGPKTRNCAQLRRDLRVRRGVSRDVRACGACGQAVPIRWRNELGAVQHVIWHTAGPVIECLGRRPNRARYVVSRRQSCTDCGRVLRQHLHAQWFTPGRSVFELVNGKAPLLVAELADRGPNCIVECQAA